MKVIYHDGIKRAPELLTLAEQATESLEVLTGRSASSATAAWDTIVEGTRSVVTLQLQDFAGQVATAFEPWELSDPNRMSMRLNRLWGDLLEVRSHKQLEELLRSEGAQEGG